MANSKAAEFLALHNTPHAFVIPNPWDVGSARILSGLGFSALATSSQGLAFALGYKDGHLSRDQVLEHCRDVAHAVDIPVSADLEQGFGDTPEEVAQTITVALDTGLAGGSIEDFSGSKIYDAGLAEERIEAAVAAKASHEFVLTARAENFIRGNPDLDDTIKRLQTYSACGADVLYAPGLPSIDAVRTLCAEVDKPVNILIAGPLTQHSVDELSDAGAARLSLGSMLARHVLASLVSAAQETLDAGTFSWTHVIGGGASVDGVMR